MDVDYLRTRKQVLRSLMQNTEWNVGYFIYTFVKCAFFSF